MAGTRFDAVAGWAKRHWLVVLAGLLGLALLLDSAVAWTYVAKRRLTEYPVVDLLERYYVLRPFRALFPDQYPFPSVLRDQLKGELSSAAAVRQFWVSDPLLGHRLAPNALILEATWTWRATNAQGFVVTDARDPLHVYARPKPSEIFRVIVLGGSTVEGDGATGSLAALPAQLLEILRAQYIPAGSPDSRFEVINAGVGGYTSKQQMLYLLSELRFFQPDLVIAYDGWNDEQFVNLAIARSGTDYPWLQNDETEAQRNILTGYYEWGSVATLFLQRTATRTLELLHGLALFDTASRALRGVGPAATVASGAPAGPVFSPESAARYVENETRMAAFSNSIGAHAAWFLQPLVGLGNKPPHSFREQDYVRDQQAAIGRRKAFCTLAEEGQRALVGATGSDERLCAASLTDVFDGNPDRVFEDGGHLFDIGNEIVAARIASELARCGVIRAKAATP